MVIWSAFDANNYSMSIATAFEFFEQCFGFMRSYIKAKIVVFSWDKVNIIYTLLLPARRRLHFPSPARIEETNKKTITTLYWTRPPPTWTDVT